MGHDQPAEASVPRRLPEPVVERSAPAEGRFRTAIAELASDDELKRAFDVVVAGLLLIALSPVLLIVALVVLLDSSGPALYRCPRIGRDGREFSMLKFRKMVDGALGPPLRTIDDERHTRLAPFLTRSRLDELPQLWNVLVGDMSLVGPRPEDPSFVAMEPHAFEQILRVRPGLTGFSQLAFADEREILDPDDPMLHYVSRILPQKIGLDLLYTDCHTIGMDLRILAWTAVSVLFRQELAVHRSTGALNRRRRSSQALMPGAPIARPPLKGSTGHLGNAPSGNGAAPDSRHGAISTPTAAYLQTTPVVILAGGRGTRLAPYTSILPKPLMPIGDHSLLETIVMQLAEAGVTRVHLCVGHLSHLIRSVLDHRPGDGLQISYVDEPEPLGTAGPLRLVDGLDDTFIVMNADVLTRLDFEDLLRRHRASGNLLTIAAHDRHTKIDYGVLRVDAAGLVWDYEEKPDIVSPVSMGVYVLEPSALDFISERGQFDFPDLVHAVLRAGETVGAYSYDGLWFDIGRQRDYEAAVAAWSTRAAS